MEHAIQQDRATNVRRWPRRRRYFVNPAFQWKYILAAALTVFLISSSMSSVLYGLLHHQARMRVMNPETYVAAVPLVVIFFGVAFSVVSAGAVGVGCLFLSHRICGPLFVVERHLGELAAGRFPRLRPLRRRDEFKDFYANFSKTIDSLKAAKQAEFRALTEALNTAKSALDADEEGLKEALESLTAQVETLREKAAEALGGA